MNQCQKSQSFTTDVFQQSMRNYKRNTNSREGTNRKWPTGGMISWAVLFREKLPHHSTTHEMWVIFTPCLLLLKLLGRLLCKSSEEHIYYFSQIHP